MESHGFSVEAQVPDRLALASEWLSMSRRPSPVSHRLRDKPRAGLSCLMVQATYFSVGNIIALFSPNNIL